MRKSLPPLLVSAAISLLAAPAQAAPDVVASVKPLHSLVAGVMEGVGTPELLVTGAGSPHGFSMRPSDAAKLESAEIVFWIGEGMETFLEAPLETLAGDAVTVEMMGIEGISVLGLREGGLFEAHSHEEDDHAEDGDEHDDHDGHAHEDAHDHEEHADGDAHIWLDPQNARLMVAAIADALIDADPANAETYNANGQALVERISGLQARIQAQLEPVRGAPFFVFHDAYHYFEARFGIEAAGSFTVNPEIAPGAGRLTEIQDVVAETGAVCIFAEPQFSPQVIETVAQGTDARVGVLDPLGAEIADGPELYFGLMQGLADSLTDCLAG